MSAGSDGGCNCWKRDAGETLNGESWPSDKNATDLESSICKILSIDLCTKLLTCIYTYSHILLKHSKTFNCHVRNCMYAVCMYLFVCMYQFVYACICMYMNACI